MLRPVGTLKNGVNAVLKSITRMIINRGKPNDQLSPTMMFYFARLVETPGAYVVLHEHIGSSKLLPITPPDLTTRACDLMKQRQAWKDITGASTSRNSSGN